MTRAVLCRAWGGPESLAVEDIAPLVPGPGEVRIDIAACGVNFADTLIIAGKYQHKPDFPFSPGLEVAGVVSACAEDVTACVPGDRVMALLDHGGYAEQVVVRADDAVRLPEAMDFVTAGGFPVVYGTAYGALAWRAGLAAGETLLVLGAGGGVGATAVEVGKAMGATVIAAAGGRDKLARAHAHGADHLVDYRTEDLRERVNELTGRRGCDVIYDPVGGDAFDAALRCVAWEGRIVVIGFASGRIAQAPTNILLVKNCAVLGFALGTYRHRDPARCRAALETLLGWYADGRLVADVAQRLPLDQAGAALRMLMDRAAPGKVVLTTEAD